MVDYTCTRNYGADVTHYHYLFLVLGNLAHSDKPPATRAYIRVDDELFARVYGLRNRGYLHLMYGKGCLKGEEDTRLFYVAEFPVHMYIYDTAGSVHSIHRITAWWGYPGKRMFVCRQGKRPNADTRDWLCQPAQEYRL